MESLICPGPGPGPWRTSIRHVHNDEHLTRVLLPNQVRIQVIAAGIDFPQILTVEGKHVRPLGKTPCVLGRECSGKVVEIGSGVMRVRIGDVVFGDAVGGSWCSQAILNEQDAFVFDANKISPTVMAGMSLNYGTSFHALVHQGEIKRGEIVLVLGAGGGVGSAAVDIAKAHGCRVIACASSHRKLLEAKRCGADELVDYSDITKFRSRVEALAPGGIDVCYDPVGGKLSELCIRMLKFGGRHIVVGFASGGDTPKKSIPHVPLNLALLNERKIVGVLYGGWKMAHPHEARIMMELITDMCERGTLRPHVSATFSLAAWTEAIEALMAGEVVGKIVFSLSSITKM